MNSVLFGELTHSLSHPAVGLDWPSIVVCLRAAGIEARRVGRRRYTWQLLFAKRIKHAQALRIVPLSGWTRFMVGYYQRVEGQKVNESGINGTGNGSSGGMINGTCSVIIYFIYMLCSFTALRHCGWQAEKSR